MNKIYLFLVLILNSCILNYESLVLTKTIPKNIIDDEQLSFGNNIEDYGKIIFNDKSNKCYKEDYIFFINDKANSTLPYDIKSILREILKTSNNKEIYDYSQIKSNEFVLIEIYRISQDTPSLYFFYLSLAWFTLPPYWTNDPGFLIQFKKQENGEYKVDKEYYIKENYYQWLVLLPFAIVNYYTLSAEDSVKSIVEDYHIINCEK